MAAAAPAVPPFQRAAIVKEFSYGDPQKQKDALAFVTDKPVPEPKKGQVLVRLRARSVNPADGLAVMGFYPGFAPPALPATLGLEGVGEVVKSGPDADEFKVGDRVVPIFSRGLCAAGEGSWQEYVAADEGILVPVPDFVSDGAAAQLINPVTVWGMLQELNTPKGEYLLQTQAGSSFGRQLITLAKSHGIRTINVVRRKETIPELKALGADEVVCSADEDVTKRVLEITGGKGAYGAVESVAGDLTAKVVSAVREGGTVLLFGAASGSLTSVIGIQDVIFRGIVFKGFWVNHFIKSLGGTKELRAFYKELFELMKTGDLAPTVDKTYDLSEFQVALQEQSTAGRQGKYVLTG